MASGKAGSKNKKRAAADKKEEDFDVDERAMKRGKVSWGVRD